ncbi:GNAT family N-acetyltransferase [Allostreptomyces psammosilenae]|uniref:GNAT superfamily N-acetyltransferase n=1 Tax=Allostreptomyces psammosilenae TaxID=1892865 RepID=A0A852ZP30_9ACTN|nr:GNAT family N-acetyltransferase [Allostreptomyces psammosilenae]NYI03465.1 GNAT superfamily N-acetyltransferase [Allostreptomyces psammosilenae]
MATFEIGTASANEARQLADWADDEGWNPGISDWRAFLSADPTGFLIGRLDGEAVASISAVRYGTDYGFLGFYIARPSVRGQGYGIQVWRAGMARLAGRHLGLDGVVEQQDNYRRSGFRTAWNHVRYEGVPGGAPSGSTPASASGSAPGGVDDLEDVVGPEAVEEVGGVRLVDARTVPFDQLAAYDRRFFPAPRDAFLATWLSLPGQVALAAVRDGDIHGFGVLRPARGASRIGPLYAASTDIAETLVRALSGAVPGTAVAIDVPDVNRPSVRLMERLGLTPTFEVARMFTGPGPEVDLPGIFATTSLELG